MGIWMRMAERIAKVTVRYHNDGSNKLIARIRFFLHMVKHKAMLFADNTQEHTYARIYIYNGSFNHPIPLLPVLASTCPL